jgi:zinc protease
MSISIRSGRATRAWILSTGHAIALLALISIGAGPTRAGAQGSGLSALMRDTTLENGLRVVVVPNATVPLVTMQVTIRNGAFTQLSEADEGVPHLLEHMLFRSYGRSGFGEHAYRLNASYNGTTSDETVTYYLTLPSENLDRGVRLLADLVRRPRFDRSALESEQRVVAGELERSASSASYLLSAMVNQKLWGDARGRKNAIGNMLTIRGATHSQLTRMYERFYVPNNAAIVFSGDVTAEAAFSSSAEHFVRWERRPDPFADLVIPNVPELPGHEVVIVGLDAEEVTILVRWHGPSVTRHRNATYAADVFASIINDPVSDAQARLVDTGLFQSVSLSYLTRAHVGPISLYATTTADRLEEASAALRAEIDRFSEPGYVTAEIVEIAQKRREVDRAMDMETPSGLAYFVGELWSVADLDYARGYVAAMQSQTEADLERFVATYLTNRPRVMGILLSPTTRHELGRTLGTALEPWRR